MEAVNDAASGIGRIITNLLSLEFALRLFLYDTVGPPDPGLDIHRIGENEFVKKTPLTDYDTLGELIKKVNKYFESLSLTDRIDETLVELRDALAHGRILSSRPVGPFRLYKFGKPKDGLVRLTRAVDLSPEWLETQVRRTHSELCKVVNLGHMLRIDSFPDPVPGS